MPVLIPDGWESFDGGGTSCGELGLAKDQDIDCIGAVTCVTLTVSGGVAPYTWEATVGNITPTGDFTAQLCAPTNSGSGEAGTAYMLSAKFTTTFCQCRCIYYGCDDEIETSCTSVGCGDLVLCPDLPWGTCSCSNCANSADALFTVKPAGDSCHPSLPIVGDACAGVVSYHHLCDLRSAGMVSAGCNPCKLSMDGGSVVTVTDALGSQAFIAVNTL